MKRFFTLIILIAVFACFGTTDALAKRKSKAKTGIPAEKIEQLQNDVHYLTKKIYANSLFSPEDNEKLIEVKMVLDAAMLSTPDPTYAPMYYNAGLVYAYREFKDEAVECFQTILENFGDTALAPKARKELAKMGIEVKAPEVSEEDEEE